MEYLYNLNSKSKTVKFFKWAWGVDPTIKYKTMCPYFWAFIGRVVFWKHIGMLFKSIWFGIRIFFNMIGNLYKQNCPIIHWK
jgi:hypothetical protein